MLFVTNQEGKILPEESDEVEEEEEDEEMKIGPHPDASTSIIFTNCLANSK